MLYLQIEEEKAKKEAAGEDVEKMDFQGLTREEAWEAMEEVMKVFLDTDNQTRNKQIYIDQLDTEKQSV